MKAYRLGILITLLATGSVFAKDFSLPQADDVLRSFTASRPVAAPAGQQIEVGFAPKQGTEEIVLR